MTPTPAFDPLLVWLRGDSRSVRDSADAIVIASDEETLDITRDLGQWRVRKTWRDQDRGIVFMASAAEDVDRYLTLHFANEIRAERGLRPVRHGIELLPDGTAVPASGFTITGDLDNGFVLSHADSGRTWGFGSDIEAARFSRYVDVSAADLREAIGQVERDLRASGLGPPARGA